MTNFEKIKSIDSINEMALFLVKNVPQWGWEDECIVDCPYNGNCSNNCAMHFLNEEYEQ